MTSPITAASLADEEVATLERLKMFDMPQLDAWNKIMPSYSDELQKLDAAVTEAVEQEDRFKLEDVRSQLELLRKRFAEAGKIYDNFLADWQSAYAEASAKGTDWKSKFAEISDDKRGRVYSTQEDIFYASIASVEEFSRRIAAFIADVQHDFEFAKACRKRPMDAWSADKYETYLAQHLETVKTLLTMHKGFMENNERAWVLRATEQSCFLLTFESAREERTAVMGLLDDHRKMLKGLESEISELIASAEVQPGSSSVEESGGLLDQDGG